MKMSATGSLQPEKLPPTPDAAYYHCLRIHLQIVEWKSLKTVNLEPTDSGWKKDNQVFVPVSTKKEAGPQDILKVVRFKCKSTSRNQCGTALCTCRKNGLKCVAACGDCHGIDCRNAHKIDTDDDI